MIRSDARNGYVEDLGDALVMAGRHVLSAGLNVVKHPLAHAELGREPAGADAALGEERLERRWLFSQVASPRAFVSYLRSDRDTSTWGANVQ
jgi:hypothetical protein